eukprot:1152833-Pelagomonas_calceolata.AAC.4
MMCWYHQHITSLSAYKCDLLLHSALIAPIASAEIMSLLFALATLVQESRKFQAKKVQRGTGSRPYLAEP